MFFCRKAGNLIPEKRQEVTTEGGLDVVGGYDKVADAVKRLQAKGIVVSLFLDPDPAQIDAAKKMGAEAVELHTGAYANAASADLQRAELEKLIRSGRHIAELGMKLHAGHGLTYHNVRAVARIPEMAELNIGHSIIARALFVGLTSAVAEMKRIINEE